MKNDFLELYKEYEQLLRESGTTPRDIEESMDECLLRDRLIICRQFRNYLSHASDPGFLEPSPKMMKFLQELVDARRMRGDVVKNYLKKPAQCMLHAEDLVSDAVAMFSRLRCHSLVVIEREPGRYGMLSIFDLISLSQSLCSSVGSVKHKLLKPSFCSPADFVRDMDSDKVWLCTSTGEPDGKLLGQAWLPKLDSITGSVMR